MMMLCLHGSRNNLTPSNMKKLIIISAFIIASLGLKAQCVSKLNPDSVIANGKAIGMAYKYFDENVDIVYSAIVLYDGNYYEMEAYWVNIMNENELIILKYKGGNMYKKSKRWVKNVLYNEDN